MPKPARGLSNSKPKSPAATSPVPSVATFVAVLVATLATALVKSLLDKSDEKLENWRNISEWLDDAGYKNQSINVPGLDLSPDKAVVNVTNINIEHNQIVFLISMKIPTS